VSRLATDVGDERASEVGPRTRAPAPERLRLADIPDKRHLAGAGNWLYLIPFRGGQAVLKVYFGNRHALLHVKKTVGNLLLTGRTSHMPRARYRQELDCIRIWERHGFRCFGIHPEVVFEDLPAQGYLLFDHVPGRHFREYFRDESVPLEERMATWRRWLVEEWHRRHRCALEQREPRLVHENGDVKHVMLWQGGFVSFDFEVCYRSRDVRDLVGREVLAYLRSVGKFFGDALYDRMMDEVVAHYPDRALLRAGYEHAFENRNPFARAARALDRALRRKHAKPYSKYSVALDLMRRLDGASLTSS